MQTVTSSGVRGVSSGWLESPSQHLFGRNAAHQPPQLVLVPVVPLFLDSNGEPSQAVWSLLPHIDKPLKHIPCMLSHVQIWRTHRPVFSDVAVGLFVGFDDSGMMSCGIFIHKGWSSQLGELARSKMTSHRISSLYLAAVMLPSMTSKVIL